MSDLFELRPLEFPNLPDEPDATHYYFDTKISKGVCRGNGKETVFYAKKHFEIQKYCRDLPKYPIDLCFELDLITERHREFIESKLLRRKLRRIVTDNNPIKNKTRL